MSSDADPVLCKTFGVPFTRLLFWCCQFETPASRVQSSFDLGTHMRIFKSGLGVFKDFPSS